MAKLFGVGLLGTLDTTMQLGRAKPQDELAPAALFTGLPEFSSEFTAVSDLHGSDWEWHPFLEAVEELRGGGSGRTSSGSTGRRLPGWTARYTLSSLTA